MCIYIYTYTTYTLETSCSFTAHLPKNSVVDSSKSSSNSVKGWWAGPPVVASHDETHGSNAQQKNEQRTKFKLRLSRVYETLTSAILKIQ